MIYGQFGTTQKRRYAYCHGWILGGICSSVKGVIGFEKQCLLPVANTDDYYEYEERRVRSSKSLTPVGLLDSSRII